MYSSTLRKSVVAIPQSGRRRRRKQSAARSAFSSAVSRSAILAWPSTVGWTPSVQSSVGDPAGRCRRTGSAGRGPPSPPVSISSACLPLNGLKATIVLSAYAARTRPR